MKKILLGFFLLITTNIIFCQLTSEQEKLYREVLKVNKKIFSAMIQGSHTEFDQFFDKNIIILQDHRNRKFNLNQFKDSISQKKLVYDTIYDLKVTPQFYNNNKICVLIGDRRIVYKYPKLDSKITFSEAFYLDDKNQWKIFYFHANKPEN